MGCPLQTHSPNLESQAQGLHITTHQRSQSDESPLNQRHQGYCRTRRNALEKQKKPGSQTGDRPICGDIRLPAPLPHAPEDLEDFQQNLQALASTVEELDNTFAELQTADSPQETTSAVEMLDEASPPAAEPSTTYGRHQPGSLNSTDHTFANAALIAQFARRAGAGTFSRTRGLTTCACVSTCRRIACSWAALKSGNRAHRS